VSFGTYARKARDSSLPYGYRINALAGCVQLYRPIGYRATFAYLEHVAGPVRRDEVALPRALDVLSASRDLWLNDLSAYARRRRLAKQLGRRSPTTTDGNPSLPHCWYGDPQRAALFALSFLLRNSDRIANADPGLVRLASVAVDSRGNIGAAGLAEVAALRQRYERLRDVAGWPDVDWPNWRKANQSLWILQQVSYAVAMTAS
jgi:hypothetical protein